MPTRSEILSEVQKAIHATKADLELSDIGEDFELSELGLDSITLVELSVRLEDQFGDTISLDAWVDQETERSGGNLTVGSLVSYLEGAVVAA